MPGRSFVTNSEGERYQFTGHEFDSETTYDYHGARYYNREMGRYMSVDPLAMKFPGWSTYNYVMGNPIMLIDPTGKAPEDWIGKKDANGNTTWEWDPNVDGPDKLPSRYTEYAKPGDKYLSQDYDSEGNQRWVKLGRRSGVIPARPKVSELDLAIVARSRLGSISLKESRHASIQR